MLRPRNFNKLIHKTYSCWHNSTTTFGRQFFQIQNGNGCQSPCKIPFKYTQLYQRYQFFNGNERWTSKQNAENEMDLEIRYLELNNSKKLKLKLEKGRSGNKNFRILKLNKFDQNRDWFFSSIPVPEDAYAFVRALDELIRELAAEDFEQYLLQIKDPKDGHHQISRVFKLGTVGLTGLFHNFQLELALFSNNDRGMMEQEICLGLIAVNKTNNKRRMLNMPLKALPWLREQMAEMLALHDGTEQIEKVPAQIPDRFLQFNICEE